MKNFVSPFLLAFAVVSILGVFSPEPPVSGQGPVPKSNYEKLFEEKLSEIRALGDKKIGKEYGEDMPDQAFLFDKLKRMNPFTGEVPENALMLAYNSIVEQFGPYLPGTETSNNGISWDERGPSNVGGRTRAILFDPNDASYKAVFAGGVGGGLWYTPDITIASPSWSLVSPTYGNVAVSCIVADPSNPQIMYFGTGEGYPNADSQRGAGIYKSTNGGQTWDILPSTQTSGFYFVIRMEVDANGNLYAGTKNGVQKSTDGGATFYKVLGNGTGEGSDGTNDVEITSDGDLYVSIDGYGVYRSPAGPGQGEVGSFTQQTTNFAAGYGRIELSDAISNPEVIYALVENGGGVDKVYKTTNGGTTWFATPGQAAGGSDFSNGQAWYDLDIEVSPTDANRVFVGGLHVYRTTNGGTSWSQTTGSLSTPYIHVDQHYITFRPGNSNYVLFANDGGLYLTTNGGTSFTSKNTGYNVTQFYAIAVDQEPGSNVVIGGTQDNGTQKLSSAGIGASNSIQGSDGSFCAIDAFRGDTMYMTTQYETVRRTKNGGTTSSNITNGALNSGNTMFINPIELDPNDTRYLYQGSTSLWRHNNAPGGSSSQWTRCTAAIGQVTAIGISKSTPNLVYAAAGSGIYRIPNANTTNSTFSPPVVGNAGSGYISCISVNPSDGNHIVVTYSSYGITSKVIECRDAQLGPNATWKNLTGNLPDLPVNWAIFEPNNYDGLLIGTDLGVFRATDITLPSAQVFWSPERTGLGMVRVNMLRPRYSDNMVFAGTHGRGIFSTNSYNQPPVAAFGTISTFACGGNVQFTDSSFNAPQTWAWEFGDGGTSTTQFPSHTYATSGNYDVQLIVSNANGSDTIVNSINIVVVPGAVAVAGPDLLGCSGDSVQLTASGGVSYSWTPAANLDDANSQNPVAAVAGDIEYIVTVTDSNGCTDTDTTFVDMQSAPNIWAGQDQTISVIGDSVQLQASGGVTYSWSPTTGLSCTTCSNPKCSVPVSTTYTVTGSNAAGCQRTDVVTVHVNIVSIDNPLGTATSQLLPNTPNPFSEETTVSWYLSAPGEVTIDVLDFEGRTVATIYSGIQSAGTYHSRWQPRNNGTAIASGVYFIRMRTGNKQFTRKMIIL